MPLPPKPVAKIITDRVISPISRAEPGSRKEKPATNAPLRVVNAAVPTKISTQPVKDDPVEMDTEDFEDTGEDLDLEDEILDEPVKELPPPKPISPVVKKEAVVIQETPKPPAPIARKEPILKKAPVQEKPITEQEAEESLKYLESFSEKTMKKEETPKRVEELPTPPEVEIPQQELPQIPPYICSYRGEEVKEQEDINPVFSADFTKPKFTLDLHRIVKIHELENIVRSLSLPGKLCNPYKFWEKEVAEELLGKHFPGLMFQYNVPKYQLYKQTQGVGILHKQMHEIWITPYFNNALCVLLDLEHLGKRAYMLYRAYWMENKMLFL
jgi:hypothetical protein